jgi:hypothetical protein
MFPMVLGLVPSAIKDDPAIRKFRQRQKVQAKAALLPQLATKADEKGVSLFAYLADLVPQPLRHARVTAHGEKCLKKLQFNLDKDLFLG